MNIKDPGLNDAHCVRRTCCGDGINESGLVYLCVSLLNWSMHGCIISYWNRLRWASLRSKSIHSYSSTKGNDKPQNCLGHKQLIMISLIHSLYVNGLFCLTNISTPITCVDIRLGCSGLCCMYTSCNEPLCSCCVYTGAQVTPRSDPTLAPVMAP